MPIISNKANKLFSDLGNPHLLLLIPRNYTCCIFNWKINQLKFYSKNTLWNLFPWTLKCSWKEEWMHHCLPRSAWAELNILWSPWRANCWKPPQWLQMPQPCTIITWLIIKHRSTTFRFTGIIWLFFSWKYPPCNFRPVLSSCALYIKIPQSKCQCQN